MLGSISVTGGGFALRDLFLALDIDLAIVLLLVGVGLLLFSRASRLTPYALLFLLLQGCATSQVVSELRADPAAELFDTVRKVAVEDLKAAFIAAEARDDQIAAVCYGVLLRYAGKETTPRLEIKGPFSALQRARDLRATINGGVPTDLRIGCSALMLDTRDFILRMAALSRGVTIP